MKKVESFTRDLCRVIESTLDQLAAIEFGNESLSADFIRSSPHLAYAKALQFFLRGEKEHFGKLLSQISDLSEESEVHSALHQVCVIRGEFLDREISPSTLARTEELSRKDTPWAGECCMLLGAAYAMMGERGVARSWYARAIPEYEKIGAVKKATRAMLNVLVEESHIHSRKNLIARYFDVYRRAMRRDVRDRMVAGICLLNISRDYQDLGATVAALRYVNRAVRLLEEVFGSHPHHMAIAHRCHLNLELKRFSEAKLDHELIRQSPFSDVQGALKALLSAFDAKELGKISGEAHLHPTWAERVNHWIHQSNPDSEAKLSKLEQRLVLFLSKQHRTRMEIVEHLYSEKIDAHVRIARFQSLLTTLRKKAPHLVVYAEGKYRLAETLFREGHKSA